LTQEKQSEEIEFYKKSLNLFGKKISEFQSQLSQTKMETLDVQKDFSFLVETSLIFLLSLFLIFYFLFLIFEILFSLFLASNIEKIAKSLTSNQILLESSLVEKSSKIKEYSSLNESNIKELEEQRKLIENLRRFLSEEKSKTCMLKEDLQLVFIISSDYFFKKKKKKKCKKDSKRTRKG